jgi:membrane-associated phospholipid phosphatase
MENGAFANRNFIAGLILTIFTGFYLAIDSIILGKEKFFLLLNKDLGGAADLFFRFWTNMGDGIVWVAVAVYFYFYQKNKFPLLITSIIISTLITQFTKNFLYPDINRPTASIADISKIHTVPGVDLLTSYSFPSGHTATAFTIFLLACLLIKKISVVPLGFLYAVLVFST